MKLEKEESALIKRIGVCMKTLKQRRDSLKKLKDADSIKGCKLRIQESKDHLRALTKSLNDIYTYRGKLYKEAQKPSQKKALRLYKFGLMLNNAEYPGSDMPSYRVGGSFISKDGEIVNVSFSAIAHPSKRPGRKIPQKTYMRVETEHNTPEGTFRWIPVDNGGLQYTRESILKWVNKHSRDNYTCIRFLK